MLQRWRSFEEARDFVNGLNLQNLSEWDKYCSSGKKPNDIPSSPELIYKNDWKSWSDWLGCDLKIESKRKNKFLTFTEAREFAHSKGFKRQKDWLEYCKSGTKPDFIPAAPHQFYKNKGWVSWSDWVGNHNYNNHRIDYRPFSDARAYVQELKIKNYKAWFKYCRSGSKPSDIPSNPYKYYKNAGWISWGDWLGNGNVAKHSTFRSFEEAKQYVYTLNIKSLREWKKYCSGNLKPIDIPARPDLIYKNKGWKGYGDWVGTGNIHDNHKEFISFVEARRYVRTLNLSVRDWRRYCKSGNKPGNIPTNPNVKYKNEGWKGWGDFLGTGLSVGASKNKDEETKSRWKSFEEARDFVNNLRLENRNEWNRYCLFGKKPENIPSSPELIYKSDWVSWNDWLGCNLSSTKKKQKFRNFLEARDWARSLLLASNKEWVAYCRAGKKPQDIPRNPDRVYKFKGWQSWGDWLGTGFISVQNRNYLKFEQARAFAHSLQLTSKNDWERYGLNKGLPANIPAAPHQFYKNKGWVSWGDWLGTNTIAPQLRTYRSFQEARKYIQSMHLKSRQKWGAYTKSSSFPKDIPINPDRVYKGKGWISWGDWLGTGYVANKQRQYLPFNKARKFVRSLGLRTAEEWREYSKSVHKPANIPTNPDKTYKSQWKNHGDWLGTGNTANRLKEYLSFEDARKFVQNLKLSSITKWREYCISGSRPEAIPTGPHLIYKNKGWISYGDWLGTGTVALQLKQYRNFIQAREFVRCLKLRSANEWRIYCKSGQKPDDIPSAAHKVYEKSGWVSWYDWLGTGTTHHEQ